MIFMGGWGKKNEFKCKCGNKLNGQKSISDISDLKMAFFSRDHQSFYFEVLI